jgi:hypothetical protein
MNEGQENRKFGAVWEKMNDQGTFMSGEITVNDKKINIVMFRNKHKEENPKCPDWDILVARDKNQGIQV